MEPNEFKPHATITLSNSGGIEIMLNRSQDGVYYRFNYGQDNLQDEEILEAPIDYDMDGEAYFMHITDNGGTAYYLTEAMKLQ